jgi:pantoate--beta-alanine ligase
MVFDLSVPVDVVGCAIVREPDGLAMSSRNVRLSVAERAVAPLLHEALLAGAASIRDGERSAARVRELMAAHIARQDLGTLDYVEVADPETLVPLDVAGPGARLFGAVQFARARLIDNLAAGDPT